MKEAKLMVKARKCGVNVPYIMQIDLENKHLIMQYVDGKKLKDFLNNGGDINILSEVGRCIGLLHNEGVIHGDLTTSNILVTLVDGKNILV